MAVPVAMAFTPNRTGAAFVAMASTPGAPKLYAWDVVVKVVSAVDANILLGVALVPIPIVGPEVIAIATVGTSTTLVTTTRLDGV